MLNVGILGATGYTGEELIRLLHNHPNVMIKKILSTSYKDKKYNFVYRNFVGFNEDICQELDWDTLVDGIDLLFSALPYGILMAHLTEDMLKKVKIVDIGVDYRFMDKESYKKYYGKEHQSLHLTDEFVYGLSEWNEEAIKEAKSIANPGCYATAMLMALIPLIKEALIDKDIIADGKSGLSGGGRTLTIGTHYVEANESMKAYKLNNHPHVIEVQKGIEFFTGETIELTFTPHIVPMQRGLMVTLYTKLQKKLDYESVKEVYSKYYGSKPFVQILDKSIYVETKWVKSSNMCHINFEINEETNRLIIVVAIDNLIKGAAGQAIQNMNLMMDFPENMGLNYIPVCI
ncbi:N-acetyl-gamma-glutamyl-phosphate reductase [Natranaerovirga pectinivora]|uniref:N-acetyl-gamma-glutamyl-phosphate reductase n=1 Tax=Natranaerovirga pectinivora TaxID=682400 RepID=A0A4R3MT96_9FIRM|nr:N-acetyl-gamma-glutamyl-phosphate reductase [Natranaerovirga pectinivora]TCT16274.1 N-acetyl-gamma-glutamyl-phosphate reductase [Natranaerovirga pectinivora]